MDALTTTAAATTTSSGCRAPCYSIPTMSGLVLVGTSSSTVAQTVEGLGHDAFFHGSQRGWLTRAM